MKRYWSSLENVDTAYRHLEDRITRCEVAGREALKEAWVKYEWSQDMNYKLKDRQVWLTDSNYAVQRADNNFNSAARLKWEIKNRGIAMAFRYNF